MPQSLYIVFRFMLFCVCNEETKLHTYVVYFHLCNIESHFQFGKKQVSLLGLLAKIKV